MLCDNCKKNPATVHLTEIVDEQMTELHLCEECAKKKSSQMEQQFGLSDLLAGLADFEKPVEDKEAVSIQCPNCGLTYKDFKKIGRLGCSECYDTFKKFLSPLLKRIHGSSAHCGKCPVKAGKPSKKELDLVDLRLRLQKAVEAEEYEEAAKLRDRIKQIQDKKAQAEDKGLES
ncbi:MAG: UvrB/UvrC motif-containing protein [Candidatus Omnitrophica bacterium]|jgi:protein arginine kinase activator|nr:UvrB/UvrC motif-containing protein [Candidatus Omnitrophota bacterium]MDD5079659.1 UvrB/UvrC motif-containing protein [Candidatus Omnitrophota bacterium]